MSEQKFTLEQQIQNIFRNYTGTKLRRDVIERIKQMLKYHLEQILEQTVKRSILRDSFTNILDQRDLLSVVQKMGPKQKTAIGYHLVKNQYTTNARGHIEMQAQYEEQVNDN